MEEGYSTTLLGGDAVRFINEQNPTKPFFLYLAFNAPHTPYQAPQEYIDRYKNITDEARRASAGSITAMDDQIGRVVDALDKKKMRDDTLIVFISDNGGTRNAMFTRSAKGKERSLRAAPAWLRSPTGPVTSLQGAP